MELFLKLIPVKGYNVTKQQFGWIIFPFCEFTVSQSILLKAYSNGDVLPLFTCKNSHSVLVQNTFPLFAQWFATASELRQQQSEWNTPEIQGRPLCHCSQKGSLFTWLHAKQKTNMYRRHGDVH